MVTERQPRSRAHSYDHVGTYGNQGVRRRAFQTYHPERHHVPLDYHARPRSLVSVRLHRHGRYLFFRFLSAEGRDEMTVFRRVPRSDPSRMGERDNEHHLIPALAKLPRFHEIRPAGKQTEAPDGMTDVPDERFRVLHERERVFGILVVRGLVTGLRLLGFVRSVDVYRPSRAEREPRQREPRPLH